MEWLTGVQYSGSNSGSNSGSKWSHLISGIGHSALTVCLALLALPASVHGDLPASAAILTIAAVGQLSAISLATPNSVSHLLVWSAVSGTITGLCAVILCRAWAMPAVPGAATLASLTLAGALVTFTFATLAALGARFVQPMIARTAVLAILAAMTLAPVWLGPAAEWSTDQTIADAAVAISPLTYLAGTVDYDYLRSLWFYEHSAIGSLRFAYPNPVAATLAWLLGSMAVAAVYVFTKDNSNEEDENNEKLG